MTVLQVYRARTEDQPAILRLLESSRRTFTAFGLEDLPQLLAAGNCLVAAEEKRIWALLCATVNQSRWAFLRGAAITNGWRTDEGLDALLGPLLKHLSERKAAHLAVYGTALWLVPALMRSGFERLQWIVTLERHPRPLQHIPLGRAAIRPVTAPDLHHLVDLDSATFEPPYQLSNGELIQLMVTSGYFVLAEGKAGVEGYACADVVGDEGQIIRLAVHPHAQRQGIGRALLNDALAYCQAGGARQVSVNTQEDNLASLRLYQQFGFRRVGRRIPLLALDVPPEPGDN